MTVCPVVPANLHTMKMTIHSMIAKLKIVPFSTYDITYPFINNVILLVA